MLNISERKDPWWLEWVLMTSALTVFMGYSGWATFQGNNYQFGPYRSPFYPFDFSIGNLSPAIFIFWIPVLFRLTCYYWRNIYYRSYLLDPAGCAVNEFPRGYDGERKFPFVLLNFHRYFVYLAIVLLFIHWKETFHSFTYQGRFGLGVGNMILLFDSVVITIYVFSCHALRHLFGGRVRKFSCSSCTKLGHSVWKLNTIFNERHGIWAWISLVSVIVADLYIRLLAQGVITDINTWRNF
jgi:hypothetical protein